MVKITFTKTVHDKVKILSKRKNHVTAFSGSHLSHATLKLGDSSVPYCKMKNPVELKCCKSPNSYMYRVYNLMKLKPQKERQFFIL